MSSSVPMNQATDNSTRSRDGKLSIAILMVSVLMAFVMYLHRLTLGEIIKYESFQQTLGASKEELGRILGAFFFTYALFQIPAGWMSDRFGGRMMLSGYILVWSLLTGLTGLVSSVGALLVVRLACGVAQAGAYPTSAAVVRRWIPLRHRALASGMVSMGGRIGGATAALLTAWLIQSTDSWRTALLLLSAMGIATSFVYWLIVRDRPLTALDQAGPNGSTNSDGFGNSSGAVQSNTESTQLSELPGILWACCKNRSLWLGAFVQFAVNIGWAFLATWLPTYLSEHKGMDKLEGAKWVTLILACGIPAQLLGGFLSDLTVKMFGLRIGRVLPVIAASLIACGAYLSCIKLESVTGIIICCGIVSAMTDLANPSFWAFTQDVGGKNTATVLGWCNMWGNLGATLSAMLFPILIKMGNANGWGTAPIFVMFACAFLGCAVAALGIDATKPIRFGDSQHQS